MPKYKPRSRSKEIMKEVEEVKKVDVIEKAKEVEEVKEAEAETVHVVVPQREVNHQVPMMPTNELFPLNFIQLPLGTFGLDNAEPIVHPTYKKLLDDILVNYKFHSFAISHGMLILAFELK